MLVHPTKIAVRRDEARARARGLVRRPWPAKMELNNQMRTFAEGYGCDAEAEFEAWQDVRAQGRLYLDPEEASTILTKS
jgi:hypothetical protein